MRRWASARAAELRSRIRRANEQYYVEDASELTDAECNALLHELQAIEATPDRHGVRSQVAQAAGAPAFRLVPAAHSRCDSELVSRMWAWC